MDMSALNNPIISNLLGISTNPLEAPLTEMFQAKATDVRASSMVRIQELRSNGATDEDIEWVKYGRKGKP